MKRRCVRRASEPVEAGDRMQPGLFRGLSRSDDPRITRCFIQAAWRIEATRRKPFQ